MPVGINTWGQEYIRAECENATLIMSRRKIEKFIYDPAKQYRMAEGGQGEPIPLIEQPKWSNTWLTEKFVQWLDGGEPMETNVEDNLQSVALIFAAVESSRTGKPVQVQKFLAKAKREARASLA